MRIIAGSHKGQQFEAPKGLATRPTSDFVRENAFNLIGPVDGASVLELFAGSGALSLEALSRGAHRATLVESDSYACRVIRQNLDKLNLSATVLCEDAARVVRRFADERTRFDLILADPPYEYEGLERLASSFVRILADGGVLVVQTPGRVEPTLENLNVRTTRKYGTARLTLFER